MASDLEDLYQALEDYQAADQVASACVIYEEILTTEDEEDLSLTLLYVTDLIDLGNLAQAEATLLRVEDQCLGELKAQWLASYASLNHHRGHFSEAERQYRLAFEHCQENENGDYLILAAAAASHCGELTKAEFLIREALKSPCDHQEAYAHLGTYLAGQRRFTEARACFEKLLEISPQNEFAIEWLKDLEQITP